MDTSSRDLIRVEGLKKAFAGRTILDGIDLTVPRGEIVTVLGPSGAGKSVFLKCLAGIMPLDAGAVHFDGRPLFPGAGEVRDEFRRKCGFLFQGNALLDSLTALENVSLPLEQTTDLPALEIRSLAMEALRQLELEEFADLPPSRISGGMQKRLALARAIVTRPELVLFDEPTAGLDPLRRNAVFAMIVKYQRLFRFTALVVTHDVPEALVASDRVALLKGGRIRFEGTPSEFHRSEGEVVRGFRESTSALAEIVASIRMS